MVSSLGFLVSLPLFLLLGATKSVASQSPILPKAGFIPVTKDSSTLQYVASVFLGESRDPLKLVLDLNGPLVWLQCGSRFSRESIQSCSLKCSLAGGDRKSCCFRRADCATTVCSLTAENPISGVSASTDVNEDEIGFSFMNDVGFGSDSSAKIEQFLFSCAPSSLLKGLSSSSRGVLGLGNSRISLPSQFSGSFGFFQRKFSIWLSSKKGAVFLGGNPFETQSSMIYTPLISNKDVSDHGYYVNLQSVKISGKKLSFHEKGFVGAKLTTLVPYTTIETNLYRSFVNAYLQAAVSLNLTLVSPSSPFEVCFSAKTRAVLPVIDLVLQSEMVVWRISESNSVVHINDEVMCLGFVDGGSNQKDPIVIGGLQLENHLLEFNFGNSMLGFSSLKFSDFESHREF